MTNLLELISESVFAFCILQLINVILSTIKSVVTIKGKIWVAALANGIYFGFYTFIIKSVGDAKFSILNIPPIVIVAVITIVTNLIGVFISLKLMEKVRKDDLWLFKVTVKTEHAIQFRDELHAAKLDFIAIETSWKKRRPFEIYLNTKEETETAQQIISKYEDAKYCCVVTKHLR